MREREKKHMTRQKKRRKKKAKVKIIPRNTMWSLRSPHIHTTKFINTQIKIKKKGSVDYQISQHTHTQYINLPRLSLPRFYMCDGSEKGESPLTPFY